MDTGIELDESELDGAEDVESEPIEGELVEEAPRIGTLAWLQLQPHIVIDGHELPACHRIPEGGRIEPGEDDGKCRLVRPDGRRCLSPRLRGYSLCLVHAGGGGMTDPLAMSRKAHAVKVARRERRELLGIGPRRAASPRAIARMQAQERAEQLATAIVAAPLDDPSLGTIERQTAALRALDATYPLASTSVELSIPADADSAASMSWADMQALAARLLDDTQLG